MSGRAVSTSTKTSVKREGSGADAMTKTIVETTTTFEDGSTKTTTKETISSGDAGGRDITDMAKPKEAKPQSPEEFIDACIAAHNEHRTKHGVEGLKHSKELTAFAQNWADHLIAENKFAHSDCTLDNGVRIGENIASKGGSGPFDYTGQEVTDQWYAEFPKYDYSNPEGNRNSNHFSQVVWKGSKEVGFGKAKSSDGNVIVVACYLPAGNTRGDYADNVLPLKA